jgi:adenylate cyclase
MQKSHRKYKAYLLPLALGLFAFAIARIEIAELAERRLLDLRFKLRGSQPVQDSPVQVVGVDDQTFSAMDLKWPFGGSLYARAIRNLNRAGARLIVFDIEFTESNQAYPAEDSAFAAAIREAGNVVLAGKVAFTFHDRLTKPYAVQIPPLNLFTKAGASWGFVNEIADADDFTRRSLLYLPAGNNHVTSLDLEVLRYYLQIPDTTTIYVSGGIGTFGPLQIPLIDPQSFLINYQGPAGTFPAISLSSVLDDASFDLSEEFDSDYMEVFYKQDDSHFYQNPFKDKIVLIGATAEELHDNKNTPFYSFTSTPRKMPGVEVHAHALQTILTGGYLQRVSNSVVLLLCLVISLLIFVLIQLTKPMKGVLLGMAAVIIILLITILAFSYAKLWIDITAPLTASVLAFISASAYSYLEEKRERTRIREMFSHYVPERVIKELVDRPELLKLGGEKRELTILFSDIEGFTALSEEMVPEDIIVLLNDYMTAMTGIIQNEGGIIDKYEGDLIMAEFGAPVHLSNHAERACRAALKMQEALHNPEDRWNTATQPVLKTRIGINTGEVIVGNMGSRDLFDYTVLGDPVNVCSRLEKANKVFGTRIIISQDTRDKLPKDFVTRLLGKFHVRGRDQAVRVYELKAANAEGIDPAQREHLETYWQAMSFVEADEWAEAAESFKKVLELYPQDKPSRIFLDHIEKFQLLTNPQGWDGVFTSDQP